MCRFSLIFVCFFGKSDFLKFREFFGKNYKKIHKQFKKFTQSAISQHFSVIKIHAKPEFMAFLRVANHAKPRLSNIKAIQTLSNKVFSRLKDD